MLRQALGSLVLPALGLRAFSSDAVATTRIWVGNLPFKFQKEELLQNFKEYGGSAVWLMLDKQTGRSRGMALVTVEEDKAEQAIAAMDGREFMGRTMYVKKSTLPDRRSQDGSGRSPRDYNGRPPRDRSGPPRDRAPREKPQAAPAAPSSAAAPVAEAQGPTEPTAAN